MKFRVSGRSIDLTAEEIVQKLKRVEPESPFQHVVEVGRRMYPVKQVFAAVTGMDRLDFTSQQARSVLQRLGFRLFRQS